MTCYILIIYNIVIIYKMDSTKNLIESVSMWSRNGLLCFVPVLTATGVSYFIPVLKRDLDLLVQCYAL